MAIYGYGILDPGAVGHGAGTITATLGSASISGSGTSFTSLNVGDILIFSGNLYSILSITNTTSLTLATVSKTNEAGASYDTGVFTNLESLNPSIYAPKSSYRPYTEALPLANGGFRGFGRPVASWRWGFISMAQRDKLRLYCPTKSSLVYIRTRTNEADSYQTFTATMIWPDDEDKQAGRRLNFVIEFKNLVQI